MEFTFFKDDLMKALKLLEPYIIKASKLEECVEEENQEEIIELPETYFGDKLCVSFFENKCYLFISTESHQIETSFKYIFKTGDFQFCLPLTYLRQQLERIDSEIIKFEEDRFFGFLAYGVDLKPRKFLFEIEAFSTRKLKEIRVLNPGIIPIEKKFLVSSLQSLYKYSGNGSLGSFENYVWFRYKDGICTVFASNYEILSCKRFCVKTKGEYEFGVIGEDVPKILETLSNTDTNLEILMGYDNIRIKGTIKETSEPISITNYLPSDIKIPDTSYLLSKHDYYFRVCVKTDDIASVVRKILNIEYCVREVFLHFYNGHLNAHSRESLFGIYMSEFFDINGVGEFSILLDARCVSLAIEDIRSEYTSIAVSKYNLVYFLGEGENIGGNSFRVVKGKIMNKDDNDWMNARDSDLVKYNENYRNKYKKE